MTDAHLLEVLLRFESTLVRTDLLEGKLAEVGSILRVSVLRQGRVEILVAIDLNSSVPKHLLEALFTELGEHLEGIVQTEEALAVSEGPTNVGLSSLPVEVVPWPTVRTQHLLLGLLLAHGKHRRNRPDVDLLHVRGRILKIWLAQLLDGAEKVETVADALFKGHFREEDGRFVELVLGNRDASDRCDSG